MTPPTFGQRDSAVREQSALAATLDGLPGLDPHHRRVRHADGTDVRIITLQRLA